MSVYNRSRYNPYMVKQNKFSCHTQGRGFYDISDKVDRWVRSCGVNTGLCQVFICHTSASLIINENADPTVRDDIEMFLSRWVKDGDPAYTHDYEGDDDMSGHIRTLLTQTSISIPIVDGRLGLGTWQGLYVYEHRYEAHERQIIVTILGD